MTDHKAARVLDGLADWWSCPGCNPVHAAACRLGAAALRQPRLPKEWPLVWRPAVEPGWMIADLPLNSGKAFYSTEGRWIIRYQAWASEGAEGTRSRARDARRAAARAVARAVKASMEGGAK